ncbi:Nuclear pore complex protein NUP98A [Zea mays]|uniref:Nuclear pore complex protein NUP98A n=1 Tax=Zea mays TaxID=4577 RepID=A0A1D6F2N0_MAIZE|nr:Nuclear pore complex protein NUP98A [Zea mays]
MFGSTNQAHLARPRLELHRDLASLPLLPTILLPQNHLAARPQLLGHRPEARSLQLHPLVPLASSNPLPHLAQHPLVPLASSNPLPHLAQHPHLSLGALHQPSVHPPLLPLVPHPLDLCSDRSQVLGVLDHLLASQVLLVTRSSGPNTSGTQTLAPSFPSPIQHNTFASTSNPFSTNPFSTNNPFAPKPTTTTSSPFNTSFNNASVASSSLFTSSPGTTMFGQPGVSTLPAPASNSPSLFGNINPAPATSSIFATSVTNNPSPFGTGTSLANTQSAPLFSSAFAQPTSSTPAFSSGSLFGSTNPGSLFTSSGPSLFSTPTFQPSAPAQSSNMFSFQPPIQPAASTGGLPFFPNTNQALTGQPTSSLSSMVMQSALVSNPFGMLPAMPQMSIGNGGSSPSVQYGISSLPVAEKPLPSRSLSMAVPRHLSQRRIKLLPRKYNPISDGKVPFFADDEESPATPKADAFFIPRENPRNLVIRPIEQWSSRRETGRQYTAKNVTDSNKYEDASIESERGKSAMSPSSRPPAVENDKQHEARAMAQHANGNGTSVERLLPKLPRADYFTEPSIEELAAKERAEPGYCGRVRDFVVGRHDYGSIKFFGETDVRCLDLESIVEFNDREVIVYKDDSKKPPVGEGLNKAAEVTLLNIKCVNKKTGEPCQGARVERYREMLVKKAEEQGAEFVSFDAVKGEWKFRVKHFSAYGLW